MSYCFLQNAITHATRCIHDRYTYNVVYIAFSPCYISCHTCMSLSLRYRYQRITSSSSLPLSLSPSLSLSLSLFLSLLEVCLSGYIYVCCACLACPGRSMFWYVVSYPTLPHQRWWSPGHHAGIIPYSSSTLGLIPSLAASQVHHTNAHVWHWSLIDPSWCVCQTQESWDKRKTKQGTNRGRQAGRQQGDQEEQREGWQWRWRQYSQRTLHLFIHISVLKTGHRRWDWRRKCAQLYTGGRPILPHWSHCQQQDCTNSHGILLQRLL